MIQIAITGGIGCGKSLVGTFLKESGWAVCEADRIAHALYEPSGPAYDGVIEIGGSGIIGADGSIDRVALGRLVFADPERLARLNALLHPLVKDRIVAWMQALNEKQFAGAAAIIPLLFEADLTVGWDAILCIGSHPDVQHRRLMERGLSEGAIRSRIGAQWPLERKMSVSDYRIWNDGSREDLRQAVKETLRLLSERKRE